MSTNYIAPIWRMPRNANNVANKLSNYSIAFNPSDSNYIEISDNILSGLENFSISVWYNTNTLSGDRAILGSWSSVPTPQMLLYWDDPDGWRFLMSDGSSSDVIWGTATTTNEWHHIVVTYDGATLKFYHDNGNPVTEPVIRGPIQTRTSAWRIGSDTSNTRYWDGELSQFCLFDYALSTDQVGDLYNLENPMIIDGGEPIQYLPLGDNSNPNAPGSFPNISVGADSVFEFDGTTNDFIAIDENNDKLFQGVNAFTVSAWAKLDGQDGQDQIIVGNDGSPRGFYMSMQNSPTLKFLVSTTGASNDQFTYSNPTATLNNWVHFVVIWDGTNMDMYVNGMYSKTQACVSATGTFTSPNGTTIGKRGQGDQVPTYDFDGEISNVQIWHQRLSHGTASVGDVAGGDIATLYNNGQPLMTGAQPQEANLQAWYKLNQSANYDPGVGPFSIEKVGSPDYTNSNDGCFTTGGVLKWQDTGDQLLSSGNYFTYYSPLILCNSTDVDLVTTGGSYASQSSQLEYALEYSIDGGSWTTWKTEVVPSGTSNTAWTVANVNNLNCSRSIQVRLRATGGLFGTSNFDFNDIRINVNGVQTYFETFATAGLGWSNFGSGGVYNPPTDNYVDPSWQIPDARSAYPQSFEFTKIPQQYIDLGNEDFFDGNDEMTFSLWVNKKNWSSTGFEGIISKYGTSGATIQYRIAYPSSAGKLQFYLQGGPSGGPYAARIDTVTLTSAQQASEWLHICWRHNANTGVSEVIFNGDYTALVSLNNIAANPYAQPQTTTKNMIGNVSNGLQPFDGAISNYQRFNSYLDNATVEALYNDGVPSTTAIAPASSQEWYKLDNTETFTQDASGNEEWAVFNNTLSPAITGTAISELNGSVNPGPYGGFNYFGWRAANYSDPTNYHSLPTTHLGFSCWYKYQGPTVPAGNAARYIFAATSASYYQTFVLYDTGGFRIYGDTSSKYVSSSSSELTNGEWHNICIYMPNSTTNNASDIKLWIDGVEKNLSPSSGFTTYPQKTLWLGAYNYSGGGTPPRSDSFYDYVIYDTDISNDVSTIYNNGVPTDVSSLNPYAYYKFDSTNTTFVSNRFELTDLSGNNRNAFGPYRSSNNTPRLKSNSIRGGSVTSSGMTERSLVNNNVSVVNGESDGMDSTNLVTSNISRTQPYSNYSFDFDPGQSDYFNCGDADIFSFADGTNDEPFSVSAWVNFDFVTSNRGILSKYGTIDARREWLFYIAGSKLRLLMRRGATYRAKAGSTVLTTNTWYHLLATYDGRGGDDADNGIKLYVNGSAETLTGINSGAYTAMLNTPEPVEIGRFNNGAYLDGKISNTALFDRVLTEDEVLNIYNNGVPQDLQTTSTFSNNIVAWWPMDDRSSYYDGTDWVVRDLENGNDGDGNNTGNVNDLVGSAPGSDANGSGNNLAIADLKGNMYNSKENAYSINMADYADSVTNPANSGRSTEVPSV